MKGIFFGEANKYKLGLGRARKYTVHYNVKWSYISTSFVNYIHLTTEKRIHSYHSIYNLDILNLFLINNQRIGSYGSFF